MSGKLPILARSDTLVVISKPSGWLVHAAGDDPRPNVVDALREQLEKDELAPVHRLDVETSGVLILSSSAQERAELGAAFAQGQVTKRYMALVEGRSRKKGMIRRPLPDARRGKPLEAVTRYRTKKWLGGFSLLEVRPEHGRKHQIRKHLQGIGHSIVGDDRYPSKRRLRVPSFPGRLWLHCQSIEFTAGGAWFADVPLELRATIKALERQGRRTSMRGAQERPEE